MRDFSDIRIFYNIKITEAAPNNDFPIISATASVYPMDD